MLFETRVESRRRLAAKGSILHLGTLASVLTCCSICLGVHALLLYQQTATAKDLLLENLTEKESYDTMCRYDNDLTKSNMVGTCTFTASKSKCVSNSFLFRKGYCETTAAKMSCLCPVTWSFSNSRNETTLRHQDNIRVIPESFNAEGHREDLVMMNSDTAKSKFNVDLNNLCISLTSKQSKGSCHRFHCADNDKGCCSLELNGDDEKNLNCAGTNCLVRHDVSALSCTAKVAEKGNIQRVELYGGSFEELMYWSRSEFELYFFSFMKLGMICAGLWMLELYCTIKSWKERQEEREAIKAREREKKKEKNYMVY